MNSIKESKWIYILLSVLIATVFWLFVRLDEDPEMEVRERGIPVVTSGERVLENQGLMIDEIFPEAVDLTWRGKWDDISQITRDNVTVSVDVSRISEPGVYELEYLPVYSGGVAAASVSMQSMQPRTVRVSVSKIYSKPFEVQPVFKGSIADGYQAGEFIVEPETVQISGTQEMVDSIQRVQVVLEQNDMKDSFNGELPLQFLDANGKPVDSTDLRLSSETVSVYLPIVVIRQVPLSVDFLPGGGATVDNISYSIQPEFVTVSGPEEVMEHLDRITLGRIDLANVLGDYVDEYPIYLSTELVNISGIDSATVHVSVSGLTTKTVEVDNIELINVPKGYKAALVTQKRTITLRGTKQAVDKILIPQIRMVADLSDLAATGSYDVPAKVYLYAGSDVGVIGQNNVVVKLTRG